MLVDSSEHLDKQRTPNKFVERECTVGGMVPTESTAKPYHTKTRTPRKAGGGIHRADGKRTNEIHRQRSNDDAPPNEGDTPDARLMKSRVDFLVGVFGKARLAEHTGVSRSQPTRWANNQERPSAHIAPKLVDLEHVLSRARMVWGPEAATIWLESPNAHLQNSTPLAVLKQRGPGDVLNALDAEMWGSGA